MPSSAACRRFLSLVAVLVAAACVDDGAPPVPPGALRGELVIYTATFDDGTSEDRFALRVGGREEDERPLSFASAPDLPSGTLLDVWGEPGSDGLRVTRFVPVSEPFESTGHALINAPPLRARTFAMVLVDVGNGVNITAEEAERRLFGTAAGTTPSVRQYFMEASYGRQDVGGKVFGPFRYPMTGCETRAMTTALRAMVPGQFDHYLWYIGSRISSCGWSGLASGGTAARPARDTWYNASAGCVVLVQEPGHNFGMRHSSSMKCPNATFVDAPQMVCTHSEYGDSYDPMGRGCRHMNGAQKAYLGWFGKCNVIEIFESGTYTLLPTELPCNGTQVLQVPMPKTRPFYRSGGGGGSGITELTHYYLELRAPIGIDRGLPPQVQVRVSADTRMANQRASHTWFLDTNPATPALDGLGAGGVFTDPAGGVKFTVESLDAARASVRVEIPGGGPGGPAKCLDGTTLAAPGPGPETCAAGPYSITGAPPPPPPGDAGSPGVDNPPPPRDAAPAPPRDAAPARDARNERDASPAGTGGSPTLNQPDAAADTTPPPPTRPGAVPGGCGCETGGTEPGPLGLLVVMAALLLRRRRF